MALPVKQEGKRHGDTALNNSKAGDMVVILLTLLCILLICLLGSQRRHDPHQWGVSSLCWHCPSLSSSLYWPSLLYFLCPRYVGERRPLSCEPLLSRRNQLSLTLPCRDLQQPHQTSCMLPLCCRLLLPRKYHQLQYESLPSWLLLPQR